MIFNPPPMVLVPLVDCRDGLPMACSLCRGEVYPVRDESGRMVALADGPSLHWLDPSPESAERTHVLLYAARHQCRGMVFPHP